MQNNQSYQRALELYEVSCGELDDEQRAQQLGQVIAILEKVIAERPSADAWYLLGLGRYEVPNGGDDELLRAETAFRSALLLEPDHQYANLYLGHVLFDTRRYEAARDRFGRIDPAYFAARQQDWRVVKNDELVLCCRWRFDSALVTIDDVDTVCTEYERDPENGVVPREIVVCLDDLAADGRLPRQEAGQYARRVLTMLNRTDCLGVRNLQAPIARLSVIASSGAPPN